MKFNLAFLCTVTLVLIFSCAPRKHSLSAMNEGLKGQVTFISGNQMPGPGVIKGQSTGVKRKVRIYALTTAADAEGTAPLFKAVHAKLLATVETDAAGFFQCRLKAGTYSVFTEEADGMLFSALSDGNGGLSPVEIQPNHITTYNIQINNQAVY